MKKWFARENGFFVFHQTVNACTIFALALQCMELPEAWKKYTAIAGWIMVILSIISFGAAIACAQRTKMKKDRLVGQTRRFMRNSLGTVVLMGGDLSWADDYAMDIQYLTNNNHDVEVIFPLEKLSRAHGAGKEQFIQRLNKLKEVGAQIYTTKQDVGLRCTLVDVSSDRESAELKIISSKRVRLHDDNVNKTVYRVRVLRDTNPDDKMLCTSFYRNYLLIKQIRKRWEEPHA